MNNNDFLKAMSMIDDDLMQEANAPEQENEFVEEKKHETVVSGVEIYHRNVWKRVLAVAATLVIVSGSVAGGAYCFSKLNKNKATVNDKMAASSHAAVDPGSSSIYAKLKENSDKYTLSTSACVLGTKQKDLPKSSDEKEKFFSYMDKLSLTSAADHSVLPSARSIKFSFDSDDSDGSFCLDMYENGCCVWSEKTGGKENEVFYTFSDGQKVFSDLAEMFGINDQEIDLWNDVDSNEIADLISNAYYTSSNSQALRISNEKTEYLDITDEDLLKESLTRIEWIRVPENDSKKDESYNIWGISVSEDGYMSGTYKGYSVCYKIKNEESVSDLYYVLRQTLSTGSEPASDPTELLQKYTNEKTIQWMQGPTVYPQGKMRYDTITRFYTIQDAKKLVDGLSEIEWESCTNDDIEANSGYFDNYGGYIANGFYSIALSELYSAGIYAGELEIYPDGYMSVNSTEASGQTSCFKLKNPDDKDKLAQTIEENITISQESAIAEKISKGVTNYDNLKAHYTFRIINAESGEEEYYMSGELAVDAKNERMYQKGEGIFFTNSGDVTSEIVMNGHDDSVCDVVNKDTGETRFICCYHYSNGSVESPPIEHYIYLCKDIEKSLTPRFLHSYLDMTYTLGTKDVNGNQEITIHISELDYDGKEITSSMTLVFTPNGQLISYKAENQYSRVTFTLDDYVFDSPDFTMEDTQAAYDRITEKYKATYELE